MGRINNFILALTALCIIFIFLVASCNMFEDIPMRGTVDRLTIQYEWKQVARLEPAPAGARFGKSVAISGDYIIVGSYFEDGGKGAAYIYQKQGSSWVQLAPKVTASDGVGGDIFGDSVAISGNYAIVGATVAHKAYIFNISGTNWTEAKILNSGLDNSFGGSVSISGNYAVVGAKDNDDFQANAGIAYIYYRLTGIPWSEQAKVYATTPEQNSYLGYSVGISGNYAVCGAYQYEANDAGASFIYERSGITWGTGAPNHENWKINASDAAANDNFGWSVAISGDYLLVGTCNNITTYVFKWNGIGWSEIDMLTASDGAAGSMFGTAVSIAGDLAIVGAYNDAGGRGSAYVYKMIDDQWIEEYKIWGDDSVALDNCGYSVAIDGDYAVVGASKHNGEAGAVYVFERQKKEK